MELSLSGNALKTFARSITCLARVGNELAIQASPSQLVFHTLNSSRSAYQSTTFKPDFFDVYTISAAQVQCSVLLKAVCAVLRTPVSSVDLLSIVLVDPNASKVQWTLQCHNGMKKAYWITCNIEPDIQHLALDRRRFPSSFIVRPQDFNRLLANFQASLQEITVIATEPTSMPSDAASEIGGKAVELRSYIDPTKDYSDIALHTQLWTDPTEEFLEYKHTGDPVDVTFAVKELKAFLSFCEGCEVDIHLFFEKAGEPILLAPRFGLHDGSMSDFDATLVLATMLVSQIHEGNPSEHPPPAAPLACDQADQGPGSQVQQERSKAAVSDHPSDHTRIWSELSGSAGKSASGMEERPIEVQGNEGANRQSGVSTTNAIAAVMRNVPGGPDLCSHPMARDNVDMPQVFYPSIFNHVDKAETTSHCWSQHHPSNWVEADEDADDEDESDLCVQSTPQY